MPVMFQQLDESILRWIADHLRTPVFTTILTFYTQLGNHGMLFIAAALILLCFRSTRKGGAAALTAMLLGLLMTNMTIKPLVSRARPWVVMEHFAALVAEHDPNSFPSGHTCAAFAFGVSLCVALPWRWAKAMALIAAALMGWSRLYVGVHFPSDVVMGALIGTLCGLAGVWIVRRIGAWYRQNTGKQSKSGSG